MEESWKPHKSVPVEETWNRFVSLSGGQLISEMLSAPNFENADYLFANERVILELKEIQTDFITQPSFNERFENMHQRLMEQDQDWKPALFGGNGEYPEWFSDEYISVIRKPISRILEKANRQLKSTKKYLKLGDGQGVLIYVNDGFNSLTPIQINTLVMDMLSRNYSSIECFLYLTVNRYVYIPSIDQANLVWIPCYSPNAKDSLVHFIDDLGRKWFTYIEKIVGPYDGRIETADRKLLNDSKSIIYPNDNGSIYK